MGRIEALLYVYFLAMLVQALLEREVRSEMKSQGIDALPLYPESRDCRRPTARRIFDVFENVQRHELREADATTTMVTELSPIQKQVAKLLRVPRASYAAS